MKTSPIPPLKGVRGMSLFRSDRFSRYRDNPPAAKDEALSKLHPPLLRGIFIRVPYELFKFTTADENGGLGESVGADRGTAVPRTATYLTVGTAATERGVHPRDSHFHEREGNHQ